MPPRFQVSLVLLYQRADEGAGRVNNCQSPRLLSHESETRTWVPGLLALSSLGLQQAWVLAPGQHPEDWPLPASGYSESLRTLRREFITLEAWTWVPLEGRVGRAHHGREGRMGTGSHPGSVECAWTELKHGPGAPPGGTMEVMPQPTGSGLLRIGELNTGSLDSAAVHMVSSLHMVTGDLSPACLCRGHHCLAVRDEERGQVSRVLLMLALASYTPAPGTESGLPVLLSQEVLPGRPADQCHALLDHRVHRLLPALLQGEHGARPHGQ